MGRSPGCLFCRQWTMVPRSGAVESLMVALAWPPMWSRAESRPSPPPRVAPHQPRAVLLPTLAVSWLHLARAGRHPALAACRHGRMPAKTEPPGASRRAGGWAGAGWVPGCGHGQHPGPARQCWPRRKLPGAERACDPRPPTQGGGPHSDTTASGRRCLGRSSPWSSCSC